MDKSLREQRVCYGCRLQKQHETKGIPKKTIYPQQATVCAPTLDPRDVAIVVSIAQTTDEVAIQALKEADSDLLEAIMLIKEGTVG